MALIAARKYFAFLEYADPGDAKVSLKKIAFQLIEAVSVVNCLGKEVESDYFFRFPQEKIEFLLEKGNERLRMNHLLLIIREKPQVGLIYRTKIRISECDKNHVFVEMGDALCLGSLDPASPHYWPYSIVRLLLPIDVKVAPRQG